MAREYRDCGIEWIGQIPKEWEVGRYKYSGCFVKGKLPKNQNNENVGLPIIGASEMLGKECRTFTTDTNVPTCSCSDILILWDGANAGIIANKCEGAVSSTAVKYTCTDERFKKQYLFYLLKNAEPFFKSKVNGTTIPHMNSKYIDDYVCLLPPLSEQQKIADYLDKVCGEVDEMVALQESMIEELKAYKQSVITEAVTKGLNPNTPMRDSGIDWIGEIPKHWEVIKMRRCVDSIGDVDHYMPDSIETGIPYIMTRDLVDRTSMINKDQCKQISYEDYANLSRKISIEKNDVIFARYASIGNVCFVDTDAEMIVSYSCVIIKPLPILSGLYLFYYLKSKTFEEEVLQFVNTNIQGNVGIDSLYKTKMMMPPLVEQQQIASYLDTKCSEIDSLIALKQVKIEELKEYKKSVIYEYVTGKKEVV